MKANSLVTLGTAAVLVGIVALCAQRAEADPHKPDPHKKAHVTIQGDSVRQSASSPGALYVQSCMSGFSAQGLGGGGSIITTDLLCRKIMVWQLAKEACAETPEFATLGGKCGDNSAPCVERNKICHEVGPLWDQVTAQLAKEEPLCLGKFCFWEAIGLLLPKSLRQLL